MPLNCHPVMRETSIPISVNNTFSFSYSFGFDVHVIHLVLAPRKGPGRLLSAGHYYSHFHKSQQLQTLNSKTAGDQDEMSLVFMSILHPRRTSWCLQHGFPEFCPLNRMLLSVSHSTLVESTALTGTLALYINVLLKRKSLENCDTSFFSMLPTSLIF